MGLQVVQIDRGLALGRKERDWLQDHWHTINGRGTGYPRRMNQETNSQSEPRYIKGKHVKTYANITSSYLIIPHHTSLHHFPIMFGLGFRFPSDLLGAPPPSAFWGGESSSLQRLSALCGETWGCGTRRVGGGAQNPGILLEPCLVPWYFKFDGDPCQGPDKTFGWIWVQHVFTLRDYDLCIGTLLEKNPPITMLAHLQSILLTMAPIDLFCSLAPLLASRN